MRNRLSPVPTVPTFSTSEVSNCREEIQLLSNQVDPGRSSRARAIRGDTMKQFVSADQMLTAHELMFGAAGRTSDNRNNRTSRRQEKGNN